MSERAVPSRRARHLWLALPFVATTSLSLAWSAGAAAQPASANERAAAEALFDSGLKLMKQGNFAEGCPKLEQSQQMDPAVGTLLYLAECYEHMGRTASAWATFREAASMARASGQDARAKTGQERAERVEPSLSKLSIDVAEQNRSIPGFEVTRAGDVVPPAAWGSPLPIDPGEVTIEARAPGYASWSTVVSLGAQADRQTVSVPPLEPVSAGQDATGATAGGAAHAASGLGPEGRAPRHTQRTLALVAGAAGLVGVGVGSYYGVRAISKNDEADTLCPSGGRCASARGVALTEQARDAAWVSNVGFAAGGVLLAGAVVLFVTAPAAEPPVQLSGGLGRGSGALELRGRF